MPPNRPYLRWCIATLLFLSTAINYLDRQTLSILATTIQRDLHIDDIGYAKITTYFLLSYTIMYAVSGRIVDFLGTRRSLALSVTGWSVAAMLHGLGQSITQLSLCRFLLGGFESANYPGGAKAVAEWFPLKQRALGVALLAGGGAVGAVVAFPLVSYLAIRYGWRSTFVGVGAIGFVWVLAWLVVNRGRPVNREDGASTAGGANSSVSPSDPEKPFGLRALLRSRRAWGCVLVRVFTDPIMYFISFWIPKYLITNQGFSLADIGMFAWIPFAAMSAGQIAGGVLADRLVSQGKSLDRVRKGLMLWSSLLVLGSGALVAVSGVAAVALGGVAALAFGYGSWGNLAVPAEVFPSHSVAFITGLGGMLGGVAGMISQFCIGWSASHHGYPYVFAVFSLFPLVAYFAVRVLVGRLGDISWSLDSQVIKA